MPILMASLIGKLEMKELLNPKNPRFYFRLNLVIVMIWVFIGIGYIKHQLGLGASDDAIGRLSVALVLTTLLISMMGNAIAQKITKH